MKSVVMCFRSGFTVVELMVTIVIVTIVMTTMGMFLVKLLTLQENEREDAYIREKLVGICGAYADALSIGSTISTHITTSNQDVVVKYRQETGGVSLETGVVSRVAYLASFLNPTNGNVCLNAYGFEAGSINGKLERTINGDAALIPLIGELVRCTIVPLNAALVEDTDRGFSGFKTADAALGYLQVEARYKVCGDDGDWVCKTTSVGRVVRLWNHQ